MKSSLSNMDWLEKVCSYREKQTDILFQGQQTENKYAWLLPFINYVSSEVCDKIKNSRDILSPGALSCPIEVYLEHMSEILRGIIAAEGIKSYGIDWFNLMEKYGVALQLIRQWTEDFIKNLSDTVLALDEKFFELEKLALSSDHGKVKTFLKADSSIVEGKAAWIIEFESGEKIVSKPRNSSDIGLLKTVCNYLCEKAGIGSFLFPEHISHEKGCFVQFITPKEVNNERDFNLYYMRMGFLCCILMFLNGRDFYSDNMVAAGSFPVLIDTEMTASEFEVNDALPNVLKCGMFPQISISGQFKIQKDALINQNGNGCCLPFDEKGERNARGYISDLEKGFQLAYSTILSCREDLLENEKVRKAFNCSIRYLTREVEYYKKYLMLSFKSENLISQDIFLSRLDKLDKFYTVVTLPEKLASAGKKAEREALSNGYVPRIVIDYSGDDNELYRAFSNRIMKADNMHCMKQLSVIRAALDNSAAGDGIDRPLIGKTESDFEKIIFEAVDTYLDRALEMYKNSSLILMAPFKNGNYYLYEDEVCHGEMLLGLAPSAFLRRKHNKSADELYRIVLKKAPEFFDIVSAKLDFKGLINGQAGTLFVLDILSRLGADEAFEKLEDKIIEKRLSAPSRNLVFQKLGMEEGSAGSLLALSMLSKNKKSDEVIKLINYYANHTADNVSLILKNADLFKDEIYGICLAVKSAWSDLSEEIKIKLLPLYEMPFTEKDAELTCCHNMAEGNARILQIKLMNGLDCREDAAAVASSMLDAIFSGKTPMGEPDGFIFPGFFCGGGGVLYTLLQCVDSSAVSIF